MSTELLRKQLSEIIERANRAAKQTSRVEQPSKPHTNAKRGRPKKEPQIDTNALIKAILEHTKKKPQKKRNITRNTADGKQIKKPSMTQISKQLYGKGKIPKKDTPEYLKVLEIYTEQLKAYHAASRNTPDTSISTDQNTPNTTSSENSSSPSQ